MNGRWEAFLSYLFYNHCRVYPIKQDMYIYECFSILWISFYLSYGLIILRHTFYDGLIRFLH